MRSGTERGTLKQNFTIELDLTKLVEFIAEKIEEAISSDKAFEDVELEIDDYDYEFEFSGSYETDFVHTWCTATRLDPPEDDMDRVYIGEDGVGLLDLLPENLRGLVDLKVIEDEEDVEYPDYEADPDSLPGGWDRRFDYED
jgi:hypothetical protein